MTIVTKSQFEKMIYEHPNGGIVFTECGRRCNDQMLMVTDGLFGATNVLPHEGEVFDWDWNIKECDDKESFAIYDNNDILQMIQTLTRSLEIELHSD